MIEQKHIDILSKQKEDLLSKKRNLNFFQKIFFRKYTDWIVTDEIENWVNTRKRYNYYDECWEIFKKTPFKKQVELRMRLKDGRIERNTFRV